MLVADNIWLEILLRVHFLRLPSSFLSDGTSYMALYLKAFSVGRKYQKPAYSLIDNNKKNNN